MRNPSPYQPILGMVIGLSVLSVLTGQPIIAYVIWALAFVSLASQSFAEKLVKVVHTLLGLVFNTLLKVLLTLIYFFMLTPIAFFKRKANPESGWQEARKQQQMEYTW